MYEALRRGLSFKVTMGNILQLTPALTITRDQMARALEMLDAAITAAVAASVEVRPPGCRP